MNRLMDLTAGGRRVWIYLDTRSERELFADQCREEGIHFSDGHALTGENCSYVMTLFPDGSLCHTSVRFWVMSFEREMGGTPLRVDYRAFRTGEEDYVCREAHFVVGGVYSG